MFEFLELVQLKIECEQDKIETMKRIANFPIDHLLGTPFTDIVEAIK